MLLLRWHKNWTRSHVHCNWARENKNEKRIIETKSTGKAPAV
jgi:hypothetical protein